MRVSWSGSCVLPAEAPETLVLRDRHARVWTGPPASRGRSDSVPRAAERRLAKGGYASLHSLAEELAAVRGGREPAAQPARVRPQGHRQPRQRPVAGRAQVPRTSGSVSPPRARAACLLGARSSLWAVW